MSATTVSIRDSKKIDNVRPFDSKRDMGEVADLIELCFADTLDSSGRRFVRQMRMAAQDNQRGKWGQVFYEWPNLPSIGYVWEQEDKVIGNVNIIPFITTRGKYYLIANVAVHPDYRGHGIGSILTQKAMAYLRKRRIHYVWLQVNDDNQPAIRIYHSLGFKEQARRASWRSDSEVPASPSLDNASIIPTKSTDWTYESQWLDNLYPEHIRWYISLDPMKFRPGLLGSVYRALSGIRIKQWSILVNGQLKGILIEQPLSTSRDRFWLAVSPEIEDRTVTALLVYARSQFKEARKYVLDMPASYYVEGIQNAGFHIRRTLIWMRADLKDDDL